MNRRTFLSLCLGATVIAAPAFARDPVARIVRQLEKRGYRQITVSTTLLGRVKIVAIGNRGRREIILNPVTGEILRDLTTETSGSGDEGDDDDDLLDDDDDDDDHGGHDGDEGDDDGEDNSGKGSGNSGSGGGDDD